MAGERGLELPPPIAGPRSRSANDPHLSREEILALLREAPVAIAAAVAPLPAGSLSQPLAPGEWSMVEILAHLRACADVWGGVIPVILAAEGQVIKVVGPRTWIRSTDYRELDFETSFGAYAAQRTGLLAILDPLPAEAWERSATFKGAGAVLERTVTWYALGLAAHERSHIRHILRTTRKRPA